MASEQSSDMFACAIIFLWQYKFRSPLFLSFIAASITAANIYGAFYIVEMKKGLDCRLFLVVIWVLRGLRCDDDITLTTAVPIDATTPKPTTIHKRIHVDPHEPEIERAPLDLFRFRVQELRRSPVNIWNWDYWCQLQAKTGNGTKRLTRYYYDAKLDSCGIFSYTGSQGNKNNFNTLADCERYCKGATYMGIKDSGVPSFCSLQPNAGLCLGMFEKYYYEINQERCKKFIYGGCGGNQNRFDSVSSCMSRCSPHHDRITDRY